MMSVAEIGPPPLALPPRSPVHERGQRGDPSDRYLGHAREQGAQHSRQDVAGPGRREPRRAVGLGVGLALG